MEKTPLRGQQTVTLRDTQPRHWRFKPRCVVPPHEATQNCQRSHGGKQDVPRYLCKVSRYWSLEISHSYTDSTASSFRIPIINLDSVTSPTGRRNRTARQFPGLQQDDQYDYPDYFNFYGDNAIVEESSSSSGAGVDVGIPWDIYCDLASTLQSQCAGTVTSTCVGFSSFIQFSLSPTDRDFFGICR